MAVSQFVPALQIGYVVTYFGPLCFVLIITMGKEAYDDYTRYLRDQEANSQLYSILGAHGVTSVPSSKIKVGDFVLLRKNQRVPADMVLLRTTEHSGAVFIRTDQLDGETDWKLRIAVPYTQKLAIEDQLLQIQAEVYAEAPHKDIHSFLGTLSIESGVHGETFTEPLGPDNVLWTNTVLASGDRAIGVVVYTGTDTRAVMNTSQPRTKVGLLDLEINNMSKILFAVTLGMSILMVALNGFPSQWYIAVFRFLILFSSIIPISLRVNLDMGKTVYSWMIKHDDDIPNTVVQRRRFPRNWDAYSTCSPTRLAR